MAVLLKENQDEKTFRMFDQICADTEDMLNFTFQGFMKHRGELLRSSEEKGRNIDRKTKELTYYILEKTKSGSVNLEFQATLLLTSGNFEKIKHNLDKVNGVTWIKIREGTLFSDKAVTELKFLFTACQEALQHLRDVFTTQNSVLTEYLIEKNQFYRERANYFAAEHEARLASGICVPKFSSLYLTILDSLKDIFWNISDIVHQLKEIKRHK